MSDGSSAPRYGEVWTIDLKPVRGREQDKERPCVIVSADEFNVVGAEIVMVCPITTKGKGGLPWHINVADGDGGLNMAGHILCEQLRTISIERLSDDAPWGTLAQNTMREVRQRLAELLDLYH